MEKAEERIEFPIKRYGITEHPCPIELPEGHKCRLCVWRDRTNTKLLCGLPDCMNDDASVRKNE